MFSPRHSEKMQPNHRPVATLSAQQLSDRKAAHSAHISSLRKQNAGLVLTSNATDVSPYWFYGTILTNIGVIAIMLAANFHTVYLANPGILSTEDHTLYVTGTTIVASIIAAVTSSQLRRTWLSRILDDAQGDTPLSSHRAGRARVLLGIASYKERLRSYTSTLSLTMFALITTSIVATITPSVSLSHFPSVIALETSWPMVPNGACLSTTRISQGGWYEWLLPDGRFLSVDNSTNSPNCDALSRSSYISALSGSLALGAYGFQGILVDGSAIGVPVGVGGVGESFGVTFGDPRAGVGDPVEVGGMIAPDVFEYATSCFPTLLRNPVRCTRGGTVTTGEHEVTVNANDCKISTPVFGVNASVDPAGASGACTRGLTIGQSTLVFGAVNGLAATLASFMGDATFNSTAGERPSYSVTCQTEINASSVGFQLVNYSRVSVAQNGMAAGFLISQNAASIVFGTRRPCAPISFFDGGEYPLSTFLSNEALAIGAAANMQVLNQNSFLDGSWPMLSEFCQGIPEERFGETIPIPKFQFNDSRNALEDILGVVTGLALGSYWGNAGDACIYTRSMVSYNGVRVGSGKLWSMVFIIPEVFAFALLLVLRLTKRGRWPRDYHRLDNQHP